MRTKFLALPIFSLLAIAATIAVGQEAPPPPQGQPPADTGDSPENGVARISFVQGNVSVRQGQSGETSAAMINGPLMKDGALLTGENSQAEIQFDGLNFLRVASGSEVRIGDIQYHRYPVQIAVGTATYHMSRESDAEIELSLPAVAVRPARAGSYRITVMPDGQGQITVLSGQAEVYSAHGSQFVEAGQMMMVRGTEDNPEFQIVAAPAQDDFDRFNERRDAELSRAVSPRYVPPDVYGTEQLDQNGTWTYDPSYGNVWVPRVAPGWAPYREGRWVWEPYYGWTWVSYDPWGWAPYHYGSWYFGTYGWAWYPGPLGVRHYYWRPALVSFFGWGGGGFGVGFGFANVGWVPLAPFEVYRPWYGRGGVTIVNTNINVYRNARYEHAITSVRFNDFGRSAVHTENFVRPSMTEIARAGSVRGALPLAASRESSRMSDRAVNTQGMPRTTQNERFFSRGSIASTQSTPSNSGGWRRLDGPSTSARTPNNLVNRSPMTSQVSPSRNGGGWQRLDAPSSSNAGGQGGFRGNTPSQSQPPASANNNGYRQYSPQRSYAPAQSGGQRQAAPQQPVRISPPIVRERGSSGGGSRGDVHGGFGGAHPSGGGNGGGHSNHR